jgi:hypothetical protein
MGGGEPKSSLQRKKSRKCQKVVTFSFAFVTEREANKCLLFHLVCFG